MKTHRMFLAAIVRPQSLAASVVLLALALAMAASQAPVVYAATITVNSTDDTMVNGDGKCTLREAIINANNDAQTWTDCVAGTGADTINITATGTILINSQLPAIMDGVTISGPGETILFLDGRTLYRVLNVNCSSPGCSVTISGLTIQNGSASAGPAIYAGGANVTLSNVTVRNNSLSTNGSGAALECFGDGSSMTLNDVNVSYNSSTPTYGYAGGLYGGSGCLLLLSNVLFDHNTSSNGAGGMHVSFAATLDQVNFTSNTAGKDGGAFYSSGTVTVTNSVFTNNASIGANRFGGAILFANNSPKGSIDTSTFTGNTADYGGAIVIGTGAANLRVTNTTFENNSAKSVGGAVMNYGAATFTNVTFSGNQVTDLVGGYGGAVDNYTGQITLTNATLDLNSSISGSAIYNRSGATMTLVNNTITRNANGAAIRGYSGITMTNTIVSDHAAGNCDLLGGTVTDGGGNLNFASGSHDCPGISADPQLYFLGYNGGTVATRSFLAGSGAINAGDAATCAAAVGSPTFGAGGVDARGMPRRSGFCDSGAFEAQPTSVSPTAGSSPQSAVVNGAFAHSLGVHVTDAYTNTLGGVTVTYSAPASGASAVLSATTANTDASGNASVTATANALAGAYSVTATASSAPPVTFTLTNLIYRFYLPLMKK